jgi:hypothetical protein
MNASTFVGIGAIAFGAAFLASLVQAARFAGRHRDRLGSLGERIGWLPLLVFRPNAFGVDLEVQRRRHRFRLSLFGALFFLTAAAVFLLAE